MKQVLQHARTGEVAVVEVPDDGLRPGYVLVQVAASLVSAGTERAASEFAGKSLWQKAKARPDLVRDVLEKVRRDGFLSAAQAVRSRLDQPLELGYSSSGTVTAVDKGVSDLRVGDRVACAGAGYAVHAEVASVPRLLVARIPTESVLFDEAAFTTVGAAALHGIRTADVKLGDVVAVIGLGLLGQLTAQLLKAAGCRVIGMDIDAGRAQLAKRLGADQTSVSAPEFAELCSVLSNGYGVDSVVITAATPSSDPVNLAGKVTRERAIVVAVGTVGMDIERKLYYEKELDFRISRSYGPGRYDSSYEQKGRDYPIGYVRWTENRNMEAFLQLLAERKLDVRSLITHRIPIDRAPEAYEIISGRSGLSSLGVMICYPEKREEIPRLELLPKTSASSPDNGRRCEEKSVAVGLLGAGNFALSTLLPAIRSVAGAKLMSVCSPKGSHSRHAAQKFGFRLCTTDKQQILHDPDINTVVIATRHDLHASLVLASLHAGKHIFCEKPLCLTREELDEIIQAHTTARGKSRCFLMVGFNRRFAPMASRMKAFLETIHEPLVMHYRVNAGSLPPGHWVDDSQEGGGRIISEVCHFIDFLSFLAGALPVEVQTHTPGGGSRLGDDNVVISLKFSNGSQGTISYLVNGDRSFSKERVEVFGGGATAVLEDFRRLELRGRGRRQVFRSWLRQDKGHAAEWKAFVHAIKTGGEAPIPFEEIVATTLATFGVIESRSSGKPQPVARVSYPRAPWLSVVPDAAKSAKGST